MARIANSKKDLIRNANAYIENEIHAANLDLREEENVDGKFDIAYVSGRDASMQTHLLNIVKMVRFLIADRTITGSQAALTNAQVDAINLDIRTFDDGT